GGVESIWERRRRWATESETIPDTLIRFSVGIENVDDLWSDIQSAFIAAKIS
ncbi:MAG: cystathionine gamma-synthase, partial [Actinobacteria bacterium]|nr:cystathionine gamma-synthase [Actinomycetota bacterium]